MTFTAWLLASTVLFLVIYDIGTAIFRGIPTTISVTSYRLTQRFPILGVAVGIVIGHIFWTNCS